MFIGIAFIGFGVIGMVLTAIVLAGTGLYFETLPPNDFQMVLCVASCFARALGSNLGSCSFIVVSFFFGWMGIRLCMSACLCDALARSFLAMVVTFHFELGLFVFEGCSALFNGKMLLLHGLGFAGRLSCDMDYPWIHDGLLFHG